MPTPHPHRSAHLTVSFLDIMAFCFHSSVFKALPGSLLLQADLVGTMCWLGLPSCPPLPLGTCRSVAT